MNQRRYVSYIGLGTAEAGQVGAELSRQRATVAAYLRSSGGQLVAEVHDIDTRGRVRHGPALRQALHLCRGEGATLLVAALGRSSRDGAFLLSLLERFGVRCIAADMPEANGATLGIMTSVAEAESAEVRAGGATDRARLVRLTDRHRPEGRARPAGAARVPPCKPRTLEQAVRIAPLLAEIRAAGATTFEQVAYALNERGIPSARGVRWYPSQVRRVEQRIASVS